MTNTVLLEERISQSGKKKGYLALKCGITLTHFRKCCNNQAEFRASQIQALCDELGITDPVEKDAIFFDQSGAWNAPKRTR